MLDANRDTTSGSHACQPPSPGLRIWLTISLVLIAYQITAPPPSEARTPSPRPAVSPSKLCRGLPLSCPPRHVLVSSGSPLLICGNRCDGLCRYVLDIRAVITPETQTDLLLGSRQGIQRVHCPKEQCAGSLARVEPHRCRRQHPYCHHLQFSSIFPGLMDP